MSIADDARQRSARPAAAWLSVCGCTLLMVAAIIVVAGQWETIPPLARFAGLVAAASAVFAIADHFRRRMPITARVTAHFAACLAAPVGVAGAATLHQTWPVCILAGGAACLVAAEVQAVRWRAARLLWVAAAATALGLAGLAVLVHVPVGVLVGAAAVGLLAIGHQRRALGLAALAGLSPVLTALAEFRIGDGTITRIGASGAALIWAAPVTGALAATVFAIVAHRRRSLELVGMSIGSAGIGIAVGLGSAQASVVTWSCVPAVLLMMVEVVTASPVDSIWQRVAARIARLLTIPVAAAGTLAVMMTVVADATGGRHRWTAPLAMTAVAAIVSCARRYRDRTAVDDITSAGALGWLIATSVGAGAPALVTATVATLGLIAVDLERRLTLRLTALLAALCTIGFVLDASVRGGNAWWESAGRLIVVGLAAVSALRFALRSDDDGSSRTVLLVTIIAGVLAGHAVSGHHGIAQALAFAALGTGLTRVRPPFAVRAVALSTVVALIELDTHLLQDWRATIAIAAAGLVGLAASRNEAWISHLGAAELVLAATMAGAVAGVGAPTIVGVLLVLGVAATGAAFVTPRFTQVDTVGLAATLLAVVVSCTGVPAQLVSLAFVAISAQIVTYGVARRNRPMTLTGSWYMAASIVSLWWTTGFNDSVLDVLHRHDATGFDLVVLLVGAGLLTGGAMLRRASKPSSWLAYGPGLALLGTWLLATSANRHPDWATIGALSLGIGATATGGLRRLAGPIVLGTVITGSAVVIATSTQLSSLPPWAWLVAGGSLLLTIAFVIEKVVTGDDAEGVSILHAVRDRFE